MLQFGNNHSLLDSVCSAFVKLKNRVLRLVGTLRCGVPGGKAAGIL